MQKNRNTRNRYGNAKKIPKYVEVDSESDADDEDDSANEEDLCLEGTGNKEDKEDQILELDMNIVGVNIDKV